MAKLLKNGPPRPARPTIGAGQIIQVIARPIGRLLGIPENCESCNRRKEWLDQRVRIPVGRRR